MHDIIGGIGSSIISLYFAKDSNRWPIESHVNSPLDAGEAPLICSSSG